MPRHVRNFWIEVSADGVQPIATGPRSADGGAKVIIRQRKEGAVDDGIIMVKCMSLDGGRLLIEVFQDGELVTSKWTER